MSSTTTQHITPAGQKPVQIGDILVHSGGWNQTNVRFVEVVGFTPSGKSARLKSRSKVIVADHEAGGLEVVPGDTLGKVQWTSRIKWWRFGTEWHVAIDGASPWDGTVRYETHPCYGH